MKIIWSNYKELCQDSHYLWTTLLGISLLLFSFIVANQAGIYASQVAGQQVDDLILHYLPLHNVTFIHVYAALLFWMGFTTYIIVHPEKIPFVTKSAALFILVRSAFICLTHLGAPTNELAIPENLASFFLFDGDLFFQAMLAALFANVTFWDNKKFAILFLSSVFLRVLFLLVISITASMCLQHHLLLMVFMHCLVPFLLKIIIFLHNKCLQPRLTF